MIERGAGLQRFRSLETSVHEVMVNAKRTIHFRRLLQLTSIASRRVLMQQT